jgi:hypothetical protein
MTSAAMTGITASLVEVDVGVPLPPDGDGDADGGIADADGLAASDGVTLGVGEADGATLGLGLAATIVNVVVPWAISPSRAEAVVHRTE